MGKSVYFVLCSVVLFGAVASAAQEDGLQRELLTRIEALELQVKTIFEVKLVAQDVKISTQEQEIKEYKQMIYDLEQKVEQLLRKEQEGTDDSSNTIQSLQPMKVDHIVQRAKKGLRRLALNDDNPVAFHALITNATEVSHIGIKQKIVFPHVNINLGGGYHRLSGIFIAPRAGLYLFSTSITSYYIDHTLIIADLRKNGNNLASLLAQGENMHQDQGSVTVVTQLAAGDEVWVSLAEPADTSLWGGVLSSFMGCLLIPQ